MDTCRSEVCLIEQSRHVNVLGGEATAQHIVRTRHDLDPGTVQIRMHGARTEEQALTGAQMHPIHEQCGKDGGITGVSPIKFDGSAGQLWCVLLHGCRVVALDEIVCRGDHAGDDPSVLLIGLQTGRQYRGDSLGSWILQRRDEAGETIHGVEDGQHSA